MSNMNREEISKVNAIFNDHSFELNEFEHEFMRQMINRTDKFGEKTQISLKQTEVLQRIANKCLRYGK
jgi:hypothetical protein